MAPPPNDNFADAQDLAGASGTVPGTLADATAEAAYDFFGYDSSVWYTHECVKPCVLEVKVTPDDLTQSYSIGMYVGAYDFGAEQVWSDQQLTDPVSFETIYTRAELPAQAGDVVRIVVEGFSGSTGFTLEWREVTPVPSPSLLGTSLAVARYQPLAATEEYPLAFTGYADLFRFGRRLRAVWTEAVRLYPGAAVAPPGFSEPLSFRSTQRGPYVREYDVGARAWVNLGGGGQLRARAEGPSDTGDPGPGPSVVAGAGAHVAWIELSESGPFTISHWDWHCARFAAGSWFALGGGQDDTVGDPDPYTNAPADLRMVEGSDGNPIVAVVTNASDLLCRRWTGSAWVAHGAPASEPVGIGDARRAFSFLQHPADPDRLAVVYTVSFDDRLLVQFCEAGVWGPVRVAAEVSDDAAGTMFWKNLTSLGSSGDDLWSVAATVALDGTIYAAVLRNSVSVSTDNQVVDVLAIPWTDADGLAEPWPDDAPANVATVWDSFSGPQIAVTSAGKVAVGCSLWDDDELANVYRAHAGPTPALVDRSPYVGRRHYSYPAAVLNDPAAPGWRLLDPTYELVTGHGTGPLYPSEAPNSFEEGVLVAGSRRSPRDDAVTFCVPRSWAQDAGA